MLYIIDVSQSVEHDHPHAMDFLRSDCLNMTDFFAKQGVQTMTSKVCCCYCFCFDIDCLQQELFDFITDTTLTNETTDAYLEKLQEAIASRPKEVQEKLEADARVFQQAYIPRTLDQVVDLERDMQRAQRGEKQEVHLLHKSKSFIFIYLCIVFIS